MNTPCDRFAEARLLYACGDLAEPPEELELHLRSCRPCAAEVREIEEVREVYRSEPPPAPLRLSAGGGRRPRLAGWLAVAAALLVAVTGWFLMQPSALPAPSSVVPVGSDGPMLSGPVFDHQIASIRARIRALRIPDDQF